MKTALLDVNLLIALLWPAHEHHQAAHRWFDAWGSTQWATCPLTELGFVRIVANPAFSRDALEPEGALVLLQQNLEHPGHAFWADYLSVRDAVGAPQARLRGARQVTDAYLLGLAHEHGGVLATLDTGLRETASRDQLPALEIVKPR